MNILTAWSPPPELTPSRSHERRPLDAIHAAGISIASSQHGAQTTS